jgi:hypothetical protein
VRQCDVSRHRWQVCRDIVAFWVKAEASGGLRRAWTPVAVRPGSGCGAGCGCGFGWAGVSAGPVFADQLAQPTSPPGRGSIGVWWKIEQRELGSIGRLEKCGPFVKVGAADGRAVPWWLRVPGFDAPPEFVHGHIEEVQLDTDTKSTSDGSHLVTFDPCREPEIEDDAEAQAHYLLGE